MKGFPALKRDFSNFFVQFRISVTLLFFHYSRNLFVSLQQQQGQGSVRKYIAALHQIGNLFDIGFQKAAVIDWKTTALPKLCNGCSNLLNTPFMSSCRGYNRDSKSLLKQGQIKRQSHSFSFIHYVNHKYHWQTGFYKLDGHG